MSMTTRVVRMIAFGLSLAAASLSADTGTFLRTQDGDWKNTENWEEKEVPESTDNVVVSADAITDSSGYVQFDDQQNVTVNDLTVQKKMNFKTGRINLGGNLTIAAGCKLKMTGTALGYSLYLTEGEHVFDCQGDSNNRSEFDWPVIVGGNGTVIKKGSGKFTLPTHYSATPYGAFDVEKIIVNEGEFQVNNRKLPNMEEIIVDGSTARLCPGGDTGSPTTLAFAQNSVNSNVVVKIANGGKISANGAVSWTIRQLWIDGEQKLAGTYTSAQLSANLGQTMTLVVTENPPAREFHWKGGTDRCWNTAGNWVEGEVPRASDNVTINADAADAEFDDLQQVSVRNLTILKTANFKAGRINLGGDLTIAAGCKLKMTGAAFTYSLYLSAGEHVLDCQGDGNNRSDFVWSVIVGGEGTLIKKGPGKFTLPTHYNSTPYGALDIEKLVIYEGEFYVNNRKMPNMKEIVVDGATAKLCPGGDANTPSTIEFAQDAVNHDAVVKIANGGKITDSRAGVAWTVKELWIDGAYMLPGTYTATQLPNNIGGALSITVTDIPDLLRVGKMNYKDIVEAFSAVQDGDTIRLLADFTFTSTPVLDGKSNVVLDLNGHVATYTGNGYLAQISGSTLKIVDLSNEGDGKLEKIGSGTMIEVGTSAAATLTIDSGAIVFAGKNEGASDGACVKVKNGSLVVNGGTVDNGGDPMENSLRVCANGQITINDGVIIGVMRDNEGGAITIPVMVEDDEPGNPVKFSYRVDAKYLDTPGYKFRKNAGWFMIGHEIGMALIVR